MEEPDGAGTFPWSKAVRLGKMTDAEPSTALAVGNPPSRAPTMDLTTLSAELSRIDRYSTPSSNSPAHGVGGAAAPVPTAALPPKPWRGSSSRATTPLLRRRRGPLSGPRPRRLLQAGRLRHTEPKWVRAGEPDHPPLPVPPNPPICPRPLGPPRRENSRRDLRSHGPCPTLGTIPTVRPTDQVPPPQPPRRENSRRGPRHPLLPPCLTLGVIPKVRPTDQMDSSQLCHPQMSLHSLLACPSTAGK